jgi:hypothetical protein
MKEFTITPKGFKVLPVTNNEIFGWGGLGVCDTCNNPVHNEGTFVAVLILFTANNAMKIGIKRQ